MSLKFPLDKVVDFDAVAVFIVVVIGTVTHEILAAPAVAAAATKPGALLFLKCIVCTHWSLNFALARRASMGSTVEFHHITYTLVLNKSTSF